MPSPFSINVVTADGAALIAQATAANPIVFIGAKSTASASPTAADLAGETIAFYDGADGEISACSATGNVAKIVTKFTNTSGAAQAVKSVCILGKLANASDSAAVIVAAMSDENSSIVLPPSTAPNAIIRFPFNINVSANDTIETVYADGATIADLDRFVSMYKAGDPTQGDDQTILGNKTFEGDVLFDHNISIGSTRDVSVSHTYEGTAAAGIYLTYPNESGVDTQNNIFKIIDAGIDVSGNGKITGQLTVGSAGSTAQNLFVNGSVSVTKDVTCYDLAATDYVNIGDQLVAAECLRVWGSAKFARDVTVYGNINGVINLYGTGVGALVTLSITLSVTGQYSATISRGDQVYDGQSVSTGGNPGTISITSQDITVTSDMKFRLMHTITVPYSGSAVTVDAMRVE